MELGHARLYQPTWFYDGVTRSSASLLAVGTMGHVDISISMVYTVMKRYWWLRLRTRVGESVFQDHEDFTSQEPVFGYFSDMVLVSLVFDDS